MPCIFSTSSIPVGLYSISFFEYRLQVDSTKPVASRNTSAEIYVICRGFKAPKKVDPRLLDSKHLFKEVDLDAPREAIDVLRDKPNKKRHRDGMVQYRF